MNILLGLIIIVTIGLQPVRGNIYQYDSLLLILDENLANKDEFKALREAEIALNRRNLTTSVTGQRRDELLGQLFHGWLHFNADSALFYASARLNHALLTGNDNWIVMASLNRAEVLNTAGMFNEALLQMDQVAPRINDSTHLLYSYHIYRAIHGAMADFALNDSMKMAYNDIVNKYRDSIMIHTPVNSPDFTLVKADRLIYQGDCETALAILLGCPTTLEGQGRQKAIVAHTIARAYACMGNYDGQIYWLAKSAIHDITSAVKEYISLWELASTLFERGDLDRAYIYLRHSLEDAIFSNARSRAVSVSSLFPLIHGAYQAKEARQQEIMSRFLIAITILLLILIATLFYILLQVKWLRVARENLKCANKQLSGLNNELTSYNQMLNASNMKLSEASIIKEEYVGRYMEQCASYLTRLDDYRRQVKRRITEGDIEGLKTELKSTKIVEEELSIFHESFDETFLKLFPGFVSEFNNLIVENERIFPKQGELLTTELRVFALIRLGITDSEKIARFLRYSISTIYNYRTKARNKAVGDRKTFEQRVMQIGSATNLE